MRYRARITVEIIDEGAEELQHMTGIKGAPFSPIVLVATIEPEGIEAADGTDALAQALELAQQLVDEREH